MGNEGHLSLNLPRARTIVECLASGYKLDEVAIECGVTREVIKHQCITLREYFKSKSNTQMVVREILVNLC